MIYTYKLFKAFPPDFTGSDICHKSSFCQESTVTECILNLLDPSTAWGERAIIFFIDLMFTNILLAMLRFLLSPKRLADFCFKPIKLFFFLCHSTARGGEGTFFYYSEFDFFLVMNLTNYCKHFPQKYL